VDGDFHDVPPTLRMAATRSSRRRTPVSRDRQDEAGDRPAALQPPSGRTQIDVDDSAPSSAACIPRRAYPIGRCAKNLPLPTPPGRHRRRACGARHGPGQIEVAHSNPGAVPPCRRAFAAQGTIAARPCSRRRWFSNTSSINKASSTATRRGHFCFFFFFFLENCASVYRMLERAGLLSSPRHTTTNRIGGQSKRAEGRKRVSSANIERKVAKDRSQVKCGKVGRML